MAKRPSRSAWIGTLAAVCLAASPAWAQSTTSSSAQSSEEPESDRALRRAEPGYRVVNLPTTLPLPVRGASFDLTHRFNGNLRRESFGQQAGNLFGLDEGAAIGFEYRIGVARHLQSAIYRTNVDKTFQFHGKYDAIRQRRRIPVSMSALVSVEGTNNFRTGYAPAVGVVISRTMRDRVALYATPVWIHNSAAAAGGTARETAFLGLGGRFSVSQTVTVSGEITPRIGGYRPGTAEFGIGLERRAGLHVFQLTLTNTQATTFAQVARGGFADSLYLGFNLTRKFF